MIVQLNSEYVTAFIEYCKKHRYAHDESYLYDEDLESFKIDEDNPTFLLLNQDEIVGVASFLLDEYQRSGKKGRVRIFHCESGKREEYEALYKASIPYLKEIKTVILFLPEEAMVSREAIEGLGFQINRKSYVLTKEDRKFHQPIFPTEYTLTDFIVGQDERDYMTVRNTAFQTLKGSETPITLEMAKQQTQEKTLVKNGVKILRFHGEAIGIIRMDHEFENGKDYSFVAPIGIIPSHQGKGLGRELLRAGIQAGVREGIFDSMLCVNADNEQALRLYMNEGYEKSQVMVCYHKEIEN